jgi:adenylate cyclase
MTATRSTLIGGRSRPYAYHRVGEDGKTRSEARTTLRKLQHDLRTPLGQILGYSEMLEEELSERDLTQLLPDLRHIRTAATTLLGLVDGVFRGDEGADTTSLPAERDLANEPTTLGGPSGRLLLVDDEPANRELLGRQLRRAGYDVSEAESGRVALAMIEERAFDLVLLDVMMPDLNGVRTLQLIRHTRSVSELPVIMATALAGTNDMVAALAAGANDYVTKPFDMALVSARIQAQLTLRAAAQQIETLAQQLEIRNLFLRRTFGRFLSDEVVTSLLESDDGLEIRGERRRVSILVADLRGFTSLTEALDPDEIVAILNNYLATMADVIQEYEGTVDEFLGDAILAHFGALSTRADDAERSVACAIAMQLAIEEVNRVNRERRLPSVEMGIGVATGDVIVGNLGSEKRSKHTAIGSAVNLASRIEGYTLGGEILLSQATFDDVEDLVQVDRVREVWPKGFEAPQQVHRVVGIRGKYELALPVDRALFIDLVEPIPVRFALLEGKSVSGFLHDGSIAALSSTGARIVSDADVSELAELRIELVGTEGEDGVCYAKVVDLGGGLEAIFTVRFSTRSNVLERHALRDALT